MNAGIASLPSAHHGMPMMGSMETTISFRVDIQDDTAAPFAAVKQLFELCHLPTRDKIKDVKIDFWKDNARQDVVLSMKLRAWLSSWHVSSGYGSNHILTVALQPELDPQNLVKIEIGN